MQSKQFDLEELEKYVKRGLINKQEHPSLPLYIYNYTPECVYSKSWDNITLQCRGLVLDKTGTVVGRPFPKFFNYEEIDKKEIPNEVPKIFKKLDGSLIIVCNYNGNLVVATRGSFHSSQSLMAERMVRENQELLSNIMSLENQFTYLFELVGPKNRIVVNYDRDELVLLGVVTNYSGCEHNLDYYRDNWKCVKVVREYWVVWNDSSIEELKKLNFENEEGFVLKWENGYRLKVKFEEYIRLHRIVTGWNKRVIWEWLKEEKDIEDLIKGVPEEFKEWVNESVINIQNSWISIIRECQEFVAVHNLYNIPRKEAALFIMRHQKKYQSIIFNMLDQDWSSMRENVFKLIKPSGDSFFNTNKEE